MEYEQKIEQQKALLAKAKTIIDKLRAEVSEKDASLAEERNKREQLEGVIKTFVDDEQNSQDVAQVIEQYEARMKRMQDIYEENEVKLHDAIEKLKTLQEKYHSYKATVNTQLKNLITDSEDIREACLQYLGSAECGDEGYQIDCQSKVKLLLVQMQKMSFDDDLSGLNYLKNHFLVLHQSIFDVNKRLQSAHQQITDLETQERELNETLTNELQRERKDKLMQIESGRAQVKHLEQQMELQHTEHLKVLAQKDAKIEQMEREVVRPANVEYIKNVVIGFFCNDVSVQRKTIPVLATALQLSENEHSQVRQAFEQQHGPLLGKLFRFGS